MSLVGDLSAAGSLVTRDAAAIRVDLNAEDRTTAADVAALARSLGSVDKPTDKADNDQAVRNVEKAIRTTDSQETKLDSALNTFVNSEVQKSETQGKELLQKPDSAVLKKDVDNDIVQLEKIDTKETSLETVIQNQLEMLSTDLSDIGNANPSLSGVVSGNVAGMVLEATTSMTEGAKLDVDVEGFISALGGNVVTGELLVNGGFEDEPNFPSDVTIGYVALEGSQLPGWTIEAGHDVTIHDISTYPFISGKYSVNLDGEGTNGVNADFYQDFAATSGKGYQLKFDWQGWESTAVGAEISVIDTVTNAVLFDQTYAWDPALHHEVANFTGTGDPLRLRVQENPESGFNDNGFIVDNFSVMAT